MESGGGGGRGRGKIVRRPTTTATGRARELRRPQL